MRYCLMDPRFVSVDVVEDTIRRFEGLAVPHLQEAPHRVILHLLETFREEGITQETSPCRVFRKSLLLQREGTRRDLVLALRPGASLNLDGLDRFLARDKRYGDLTGYLGDLRSLPPEEEPRTTEA